MKHSCAPLAEDAEFAAHMDAFSLIWQGSCYGHPETLKCSDAEDPLMGSGSSMRQHPVREHLLVTLLLPKICIHKLARPVNVLLRTIEYHISVLEPQSWTGQAGQAETFPSGTSMVSDQKGHDTCYS